MLVRLIYPENQNDIFKQVPEYKGGDTAKIGNIIFTTKPVDEADLAVVINYSKENIKMRAKELWIFHQKPGNYRLFGHWQKAYPYADRVFGSWHRQKNERYEGALKNLIKTQSSVLWDCKMGYDFYKTFDDTKKNDTEKPLTITAITSTKKRRDSYGKKQKLEFLHELKHRLKKENIDLKIKSKVKSKDEILAASKYTICLEDAYEPDYFSEKLTDAFLLGAMPIYSGTQNIFEYFPKGSVVLLEDLDVEKAAGIIKYTIHNNLYEKNKPALQSAKNMVLNRYNLFMTIVEKAAEYGISKKPLKEIEIIKRKDKRNLLVSDIQNKIKGIKTGRI